MRNDRKIDVSFSASAEGYIRRFMKVAERTVPSASLVPVIAVDRREVHGQSDGQSEEVRAKHRCWRD
jgi:hypothetical protein